ncbi:MAG TPA: glycosyltransferase family 4 protein [Polyangiaceae bacterium]|nr:glycosyltransferase family 4 protein [Polyangiaceae bacterium]
MHAGPRDLHSQFHPCRPKRIAWFTPDYPPDRGGVSDHSSAMVNVLRSAGHDVLICSRPHERGFARLDTELAVYRPELVVVAYTPLGYAPRSGGVTPAFTRWSIGLRQRHRCRAILLAHEVSLPLTFHWQRREFKLAALAATQMAQFSVLAACFDSVLFSNVGTQRAWAQRLTRLANRFHTIRICSNIPYHSSTAPARDLIASGSSVPTPTVLFFGTGHQSVLFEYVEEAFLALLKLEPSAGLVIVGMSPEKLRRLCPSLADMSDRVHALGYVSADQVSLWLQVATLVLAPLIEGVSARKGTVMAALQHGQTVVTTRGVHTLEDIAWNEICLLAPLDREAFAAMAVKAFHDPELRAATGRAARAEYEAHASASVTASMILDYADQPGAAKPAY